MRAMVFSVLLVLAIFSASCLQPAEMRPLKEEGGADDNHLLLLQSLQRGPVSGSGPNPCTNIPGRNPGSCTRAVAAMNVAGSVFARRPPLAVSQLVVASTTTTRQSGRRQFAGSS
ncbi:unnamed protein product [Linum trigynum]|uniref:Secreted protein n=1 Tax=Linum trigynum TaxID=586398 RepID=A0AAV2EC95_9ROSI